MTLTHPSRAVAPDAAKQCCADLYASEWAKLLLGESFHPGGLELTERLGVLLGLGPDSRVLDVAAGRGTSAIFLAKRFGCQVVGVDYSARNVALAEDVADVDGIGDRVTFVRGDAERLGHIAADSFDAVLCECAFCTFPDKPAAAREMARVLRPGGCMGLSDITRSGPLPAELQTLLAWVACIADAQPTEAYLELLKSAGLTPETTESHDDALRELVAKLSGKVIGAEVLVKLGQLDLPGADFAQAKALARSAVEVAKAGQLGYALLVARKPEA